jgi:hypothetical protein
MVANRREKILSQEELANKKFFFKFALIFTLAIHFSIWIVTFLEMILVLKV